MGIEPIFLKNKINLKFKVFIKPNRLIFYKEKLLIISQKYYK